MATQTLKVPDIHCAGCLRTIAGSLRSLPSVESVGGDTAQRVIEVQFRAELTSLTAITDALAAIGFPVEGATVRDDAWRKWGLVLLAAVGAGALSSCGC